MPTTHRLAPMLAVLGLSLLPSSMEALTDCSAVEGNQVDNCGFEAGEPPSSWTNTWGVGFHRSTLPQNGSYSAGITPESGNISVWGFLLTSNCFPVVPDREFSFGASVRRTVDVGSCNIRLASHADSLCSDPPSRLYSEPMAVVADTWITAEATGDPTGPFARLEIICTTGSPIAPEFYVDDAFAGAVPAIDVPMTGPWLRILFFILLAAAGFLALRT